LPIVNSTLSACDQCELCTFPFPMASSQQLSANTAQIYGWRASRFPQTVVPFPGSWTGNKLYCLVRGTCVWTTCQRSFKWQCTGMESNWEHLGHQFDVLLLQNQAALLKDDNCVQNSLWTPLRNSDKAIVHKIEEGQNSTCFDLFRICCTT